ncbi:CDA_G0024960.mRNA.1.CDS.1 [Saccharomyces cerevisiae]|nr:CDA_G0024960.mRNA.1.CDS.1 [Saccharomyces cerevisiae]CAI4548976.1 CCT_1a_G0025290.mRNA.1.CDS.1 [Saccharomyces cerevisiae]CAI4549319.1 CCT_1a_G0025310.mRNA.1.CDS.1 [Saccharomyces cerevisiae]CAI7339837.1 CDA_G0024960.mRNA.1.CDS.1 [Saccharomyces cerevisiae]CAI7342530.1 CCT_1a_G0025290.mRNA.1.CDS.1 [Saccharomyces cerevisiae]
MAIRLVCTVPSFAFMLYMRGPKLTNKVTHEDFIEDGFIALPNENSIISQIKALINVTEVIRNQDIYPQTDRKLPCVCFFQ